MAPGGTRRDFEELVELVRVDVATPPALCPQPRQAIRRCRAACGIQLGNPCCRFPSGRRKSRAPPEPTLPNQTQPSPRELHGPAGVLTRSAGCSETWHGRVLGHHQLSRRSSTHSHCVNTPSWMRRDTAVFWDTISCRKAAPLTHTLTHAPDSTLWARVTLTFLRSWKTGGPGWNLHARSVLSFSLNLSPHACTHALVGPSAHTHGVAPAQGCWEHRWSYPVPTRWKSVMWVAQALLHKALGPLGELWRLRGSSTGLGPSVTTKSFPTALVAMSSG